MATYIKTLKEGNDIIIPRTRVDAITTRSGDSLENILEQNDLKEIKTVAIPWSYNRAISIPLNALRGKLGVKLRGVESSTNIEVKSVGKNLFNKNSEDIKFGYELYTENDDVYEEVSEEWFVTGLIPVKSNTTYCKSNLGEVNVYYDVNKNFIDYFTNSPDFTTPANCAYVKLNALIEYLDTIQLEENIQATDYEPYKETSANYGTLNRLPNEVFDEVLENGTTLKRTREYVLQASDIEGISSLTNVDIFYTKIFTDIVPQSLDTAIPSQLLVEGKPVVPYSESDNTTNIGACTMTGGGSARLRFILTKGTTLAQAKTALTGTKIIYELATPQVIENESVPLIAEPNGTVFIASDTTQPEVELTYPINYGAVVDGLTDGQKQLSKAVNELFTDVGDGKTLIANAITDKGVPTLATDAFATMATNIGNIGGGSGVLKNVRKFNLGSATTLALPEPIDSSKAVIKYPYGSASGSVYFTVSDTAITRNAQNGGTNVNIELWEFDDVKSIQNGVKTTYGSDSTTVGTWTVNLATPVNPEKCIVFISSANNYVGTGAIVTGFTDSQIKIQWTTSETGSRVNWVVACMWAIIELN